MKRWSIASFKCEKSATGHAGKKIYALQMSAQWLISAGADRTIQLWTRDELVCSHTLAAHSDCVWALAVRGDLLFSCSDDRTVKMWDLHSLATVKTLQDERDSKYLCVAVGNGVVCAGTDDCKINVWSLNTLEFERYLTGHSWEVWQLVIAGGYLFSGSFDHSVRIWDMDIYNCVKSLTGHTGFIHALIVPEVSCASSACALDRRSLLSNCRSMW